MLQRVAACCSVLQRVAACCSVLQCVAVCCSIISVNGMSQKASETEPHHIIMQYLSVLSQNILWGGYN